MNRFNMDDDVERMLEGLDDKELIELASKVMTAAEAPDNCVTYFLDFSLQELVLVMNSIIALQEVVTRHDYQPHRDPFFVLLIESFFGQPVMITDYIPWANMDDIKLVKKLEKSMNLSNRELMDSYSITLKLTKEAASILEHAIDYAVGYYSVEMDYDLEEDKHFLSMASKLKGPIMDSSVGPDDYIPWFSKDEKILFKSLVKGDSILRNL